MDRKETIESVKAHQEKSIIAFSRGKDSIAAWLYIREHFEDVIPYYLYGIPNLQFVEESLEYFETFFGKKIIRLPHPSLHRKLNRFVYQPPQNLLVIEQAQLPNHTYEDIRKAVVEKEQLQKDMLVANGVRASDSPMRRVAITKYGPISWNQHTYHPIFDMKKDEMVTLFKKHNVKLPIDYKLFGRSLDGIDLRFLIKIKEHLPEDYKRILEFFPLAELEVFRWEHRK